MYKSWQLQDIEPLPGPGQRRVANQTLGGHKLIPQQSGLK